MYEWVQGRPVVLLRTADLRQWPSASAFGVSGTSVEMHAFRGASFLSFAGTDLTTAIPLELGGLLLVAARYCDSDASVQQHLELVPVAGWRIHTERFRVEEESYSFFDGSWRGTDVLDPTKKDALRRGTGGVVSVTLAPGLYEVEILEGWRPDERTELSLTRLIRTGP